ncbi:MAG: mechanosensitive ion channel [Thermoflexibacter sp.]|jgi:small conductance mechanosensitive channel|nr:mechanosensitive ion channel [Thermoflexibacter sp.]
MNFDEILPLISNLVVNYATKIALALATLVIGLWVIGFISKTLSKSMESRKIDSSIKPFLISLVSVSLRIVLLISVASILGIETTSFVAIIGSVGLAVGLALQGSLANFAGSVLILVFKPFKVGDIIQAQGQIGTVKEIQTFNTVLLSPDNKVIILPNGSLAGGSIVNLSSEETRRLDFVFRLDSAIDIGKVRSILLDVAQKEPLSLSTPAAGVVVSGFFDNGIEITLNIWVKSSDFVSSYWGILFNLNENVANAFRKEGINAPQQVRQLHVHQK